MTAIAYWFLTQVGVVLAISPALDWIGGVLAFLYDSVVLAFLSNPVVLAVVLMAVGAGAVTVWYRVDVGAATVELFVQWKERLGFDSPVVVRGSLEHEDVRWIAHRTRDGVTAVEHRACPNCAVELEQASIEDTEVDRPNTPITADETTRKRETEAWENVFDREKTTTEELVQALVCPRETCPFSVRGEKHVMRGKSAVKKQFRTHFERMHDGSTDPFGTWYQRASERLDTDLEPTPADLWDAYARECDDDEAVMVNQAFGQGLPGEDRSVTCPALEEYKENAEGIDQLIEFAPDGFDSVLTWLVRSEYLEQRRKITRKMNEQGEHCRRRLNRVEREHGSIIQQVLENRYARTEPRIDLEVAEEDLNAAMETVGELYHDLDLDHLTFKKRRWLSTSKSGIADAGEYVLQLRAFKEYRGEIEPTIEAFEYRFEPYAEGKNYMITPDQEYLEEGCSKICRQLSDLHREARLELLPPEMIEWAETNKATFTEHSRQLPDYNEHFVARERERYRELFKTEHGPLNEEQQKAIVRNDLHNLVDASAGTGKTLTLTYRFLYLYERGVPLDDIVAITLTGDAAKEMKSRIADALDGVSSDSLNVSTYHSLAHSIVGDSILGSIDEDWDPEATREQYVRGFINGDSDLKAHHSAEMEEFYDHHEKFLRSDGGYIENNKRTSETQDEFIHRKYDEFIEKARDFDQTPEEIRKRLPKANRTQYHFGRAGCEILHAYLDRTRSTEEPVDFLDMVKTATRLGREAPEHFSGEYQHILFDEFQDVAEPVLELIEVFLQEPEDTRLFAVGDDWQSIYGFRGSNPQYFIGFDERFNGTAHTQLAINYRCPPTVVEAGTELMANSEAQQNEKAVEAFNDLRETPVIHTLDDVYESRVATYVAKVIKRRLGEDVGPADIMVIARNKKPYLWNVYSALNEHGVPTNPPNDSADSNGVQLQTIHKSKGTEAECVILVNATDDTLNGLPSSEKGDELLDPAIANTADYYAEERRLCYVALTRTEHYLHVITHHDHKSRYLDTVSEYFEERLASQPTVEGTLTEWDDPGASSNRPITATLDCGAYEMDLMAWHNDDPPTLETGQAYRLSKFERNKNGFGEEFQLTDEVKIERLGPSDPPEAGS